jgi:type VI secretion system secreted protein VgrG
METSAGASADAGFRVRFTAIDEQQQFRPQRLTPKPTISGLQSAIVVGKSGEEIYTDKYGRVKVQFHWDRYGAADEKSSCWVRVAQVWAGKGWGAMYIPRIGHEVLVDFIEGDPDRPMIVGRVYNNDNMPPYDLPDNATISTIKTNSSKGGQGFNELRFEDKKGEEQIFVHAEKNQDIRVKNDRFESTGNDRHLMVKNDKFELVENNRSEEVKQDHIEKVGKDFHLDIAGKQSIKIGGQLSVTVAGDVSEVYKANHSEETTDDYFLKASNICIEATDNITIKVGDSYIAIESGGIKIGTSGDIELEAGGNIESKSSGNTAIESTGNTDVKATGNLTLKGTGPTEVSTSAILTLKGSMTKIN